MKLVIPSEIQIGARAIRIRISTKPLAVADLSAQYSAYENLIRLSLDYEGKPRQISLVFESLIHEVIHVIDHLYVRGIEEQQTGALAAGMTQVLMSMGIEPDFSQIPEEEL